MPTPSLHPLSPRFWNCESPHKYLTAVFSLFSRLWKNNSRLMQSPCCLSVNYPPTNSFWMPESIFMKLGIYITEVGTISMAYFINPYHLCMSVCTAFQSLHGNGWAKPIFPVRARQQLGEHVPPPPLAMSTRNRIFACVIFICPCATRDEYASLSVHPSHLSLLRRGTDVPAATNVRDIRIVGRVNSYAVCSLSKGSLWMCPSTSYRC
jgi:hypothetical protein